MKKTVEVWFSRRPVLMFLCVLKNAANHRCGNGHYGCYSGKQYCRSPRLPPEQAERPKTQRIKTQVLRPHGKKTVVGGVLTDFSGKSQFQKAKLPDLVIFRLSNTCSETKKRDATSAKFCSSLRSCALNCPTSQTNPTNSKLGVTNRSTTIIQPVSVGNPSSNSEPTQTQPQQQLQQQQQHNIPLHRTLPPLNCNRVFNGY